MRATRSIPIVMVNAIAPVEQGYVQSLARPGGNVTGTAWSAPETMGKIVEVLKEAAPRTARLAILGNDKFPGRGGYMDAAKQAGSRLGMTVEFFGASRLEEVDAALQRMAAWQPQAMYVAFDTILIAALRPIAAFAVKHKLASISTVPQFVEAGGLLYYGPDIEHLAERTASYVARILKGAKPADLPVELPTNYKLIVSRKTATEIGIKLPNAFLLRADRVIECKAMAAKAGANVKSIYWTLGHYDLVVTMEAPDAATATSLNLAVGGLGNIRTETLTAFTADEFGKILGKMP